MINEEQEDVKSSEQQISSFLSAIDNITEMQLQTQHARISNLSPEEQITAMRMPDKEIVGSNVAREGIKGALMGQVLTILKENLESELQQKESTERKEELNSKLEVEQKNEEFLKEREEQLPERVENFLLLQEKEKQAFKAAGDKAERMAAELMKEDEEEKAKRAAVKVKKEDQEARQKRESKEIKERNTMAKEQLKAEQKVKEDKVAAERSQVAIEAAEVLRQRDSDAAALRATKMLEKASRKAKKKADLALTSVADGGDEGKAKPSTSASASIPIPMPIPVPPPPPAAVRPPNRPPLPAHLAAIFSRVQASSSNVVPSSSQPTSLDSKTGTSSGISLDQARVAAQRFKAQLASMPSSSSSSSSAAPPSITSEDREECVVCMARPASVIFIPCGHFICCGPCAVKCKEREESKGAGGKNACIICQQVVVDLCQIY